MTCHKAAKKKKAPSKAAKKKAPGKAAKKKAICGAVERQMRIPGTVDPAIRKIEAKGEDYVVLFYGRKRQQEVEGVAKAELIELMKEAGVMKFNLDGYAITLSQAESEKLTVKALKD